MLDGILKVRLYRAAALIEYGE